MNVQLRWAWLLPAVLCGLGAVGAQTPATTVLEHVRLIDGTGAPPRDDMRIIVQGDRIVSVTPGREAAPAVPPDAARIDLAGRVVMPGLIDLHYHIERDPKLALRQLANGVTSFRDPGQWIDQFDPLKAILRDEHLPGPRMALAGPHIDGEHPAYPLDATVARDPEEARLAAERNIADGATALKIYFRLPLASAMAVVGVCKTHDVPCTAHLEILDARDLLLAGLDGIEHITSFGTSVVPFRRAERYRQAVLADSGARGDGRYALFADADLGGAEARRLYDVLERTHPFVNPTLAVFEVRAGAAREDSKQDPAIDLKGYARMKALTLAAFQHGARAHPGRPQHGAVRRPRRGALARAGAAGRIGADAAPGDHGGDADQRRVPAPAGQPRHHRAGQTGGSDRPRTGPVAGHPCHPQRGARDERGRLDRRRPLSHLVIRGLGAFVFCHARA